MADDIGAPYRLEDWLDRHGQISPAIHVFSIR
jgi:hypothetical protein